MVTKKKDKGRGLPEKGSSENTGRENEPWDNEVGGGGRKGKNESPRERTGDSGGQKLVIFKGQHEKVLRLRLRLQETVRKGTRKEKERVPETSKRQGKKGQTHEGSPLATLPKSLKPVVPWKAGREEGLEKRDRRGLCATRPDFSKKKGGE